jgi:hypothetical protein
LHSDIDSRQAKAWRETFNLIKTVVMTQFQADVFLKTERPFICHVSKPNAVAAGTVAAALNKIDSKQQIDPGC